MLSLLLCSGDQVRLCALHRVSQIALAHDVIAVKDRAGFVATDAHGYALRYSSSDHVANGSTTEIVKQLAHVLWLFALPTAVRAFFHCVEDRNVLPVCIAAITAIESA